MPNEEKPQGGFNPVINNQGDVNEQNIAQTIDKSQNQTTNVDTGGGDFTGDINNSQTQTTSVVPAFYDALSNAAAEVETFEPAAAEPMPELPPAVLETLDAKEKELEAVEFPVILPDEELDERDVEQVASMTPQGLIDGLKAEASKPDSDRSPGLFSAMLSKAKTLAPIAGKILLDGGEALLASMTPAVPAHAAVGLAIVKGIKAAISK